MEWLSKIKVIIFDMDGTLYQEDTFVERYISYLLEGSVSKQQIEAATVEARKIIEGNHPIKLGHFYHKTDDVALVPSNGAFNQALTALGLALDEQKFREQYESLSLHDSNLIYMGDPWGVVAAIRHKYKIPEDKMNYAFERIREEMILEPYLFAYPIEMLQAIQQLDAVEKKILMTNTYEKSGIAFLEYMQILHLFDEIYCGAEKPLGIKKYVETLLEQGYEPHEILSIGDNPWNDLYPVKQIGGRTCFISPYPSGDNHLWDLRLHALDELKQLMFDIQVYKTARITS
ncbi:HAD family hydrolase [Paenibacillus sp. S3N08]|uniref:HAD family hydrolase n=1 Tax=Paenibacillus agricola TaxID=2716264 RepID=A0ABX0JFQ7_9BACL|nr:HAD family hydrolase [Paenibacillus agricola]